MRYSMQDKDEFKTQINELLDLRIIPMSKS